MIVVTGGEGFIGSRLVSALRENLYDVVSLDTKSLSMELIDQFLLNNSKKVSAIFHLGAITDTTEMDVKKFDDYNVRSSIFMWNYCKTYYIPLIYASSAATYGDGSQGFDDRKPIKNLKPLNPYGDSKQEFDLWVQEQEEYPLCWGLKFFNVYGPGEKSKGKMASIVYQAYNQIRKSGELKLFKSYTPPLKDGDHMRDFVYVDDVVDVMMWFMKERPESGLYNVGTGKARTFNDLAHAVFTTMKLPVNIKYIDMPENIKSQYQAYTQANLKKLRQAGYRYEFLSLEEGVKKYFHLLP